MSAIKLNSSGGGSITISPASTASTLTLTAPAQTGTIGLDGPAFRAYASTPTNVANNILTKAVYVTEEFDTNNCYDTGASRFTPNVAGVYVITASHYIIDANLGGYMSVNIYKNGSQISTSAVTVATGMYINTTTTIAYANGTTDYFEAYISQSSGATRNSGTGVIYTFSGCMIRGA